jgi:hypothetical protein
LAVSAQTATEYFNLAQEQASKRKHYKAIPNYKKAIEKDSTNLDYYWHLSKSILNENVRGSHRTDVGVFEALTVLDKLKHKNPSVKVYERIATANKYVLEDYYLRYQKTAADLVKEKESFKSIALLATKEFLKGKKNSLLFKCIDALVIEVTKSSAKAAKRKI